MRSNIFKKLLLSGLVILLFIFGYLYLRPLPIISASLQTPIPPKSQPVALPWPGGGQAALGAADFGILASHNDGTSVPVGSTAKIITAIAVLKQKPIPADSQGPSITLDANDVALFNTYFTQGGSVTQVAAGEKITELQALQSMLLPSSNNMADTLAKWAFGSVHLYINYANRMVKNIGMSHTTVGDTNGFSDATTSTADDLVRLGLAAMKIPAISKVVGQTSSNVPIAGDIKNINILLGQDGIYGIKTGFTEKAGGCYLFAAQHTISGQKISYVGAILSQPTLSNALNDAQPILNSADSEFTTQTPIHKGQTVATYRAGWGSRAKLISSQDISVLRWKSQEIRISGEFGSISAPAKQGYSPGKISVIIGERSFSAKAVLAQNLTGPSFGWRLFRH